MCHVHSSAFGGGGGGGWSSIKTPSYTENYKVKASSQYTYVTRRVALLKKRLNRLEFYSCVV